MWISHAVMLLALGATSFVTGQWTWLAAWLMPLSIDLHIHGAWSAGKTLAESAVGRRVLLGLTVLVAGVVVWLDIYRGTVTSKEWLLVGSVVALPVVTLVMDVLATRESRRRTEFLKELERRYGPVDDSEK